MEILRVYRPDECGADGYPFAWHAHASCRGAGCPTCENAGAIKRMIRDRHGNRCLRCKHPYTVGKKYRIEIVYVDGEQQQILWSPCDTSCTHTGEVSIEGEAHVMTTPEDIAHWIENGYLVEAAYRILTVHHLNEDKADCRWWNLVSLCQRCHLRVQRKVLMERVWPWEHSDWFKPFVAGYYAWTYLREDLSPEEVVPRMDDLLALERMA